MDQVCMMESISLTSRQYADDPVITYLTLCRADGGSQADDVIAQSLGHRSWPIPMTVPVQPGDPPQSDSV